MFQSSLCKGTIVFQRSPGATDSWDGQGRVSPSTNSVVVSSSLLPTFQRMRRTCTEGGSQSAAVGSCLAKMDGFGDHFLQPSCLLKQLLSASELLDDAKAVRVQVMPSQSSLHLGHSPGVPVRLSHGEFPALSWQHLSLDKISALQIVRSPGCKSDDLHSGCLCHVC